MSSGEHMYIFMLGTRLGVQLLGHSVFNISEYYQFSRVIIPGVHFLKQSVT